MDQRFELVIIGSGPAGMTAAVYASRAGLKTVIVEALAPGGKLIKTAEISNWPGITNINGADLAFKMYEHSTFFGAESVFKDVVNIQLDGEDKIITCSDGDRFIASAVIIATGTKERLLNVENELELVGKGVSYCAICDGAFFKEKIVTVIGGGNSALEESLYLANFATKVNIVIRRDVFRADRIAQERVMSSPKINIIKKHVPKKIVEVNGKVGAIILENVDTKEELKLITDGVFPYIGADPNTQMVRDLNITNKAGYLIVDDKMMTKVEGIYGAGDVNDKYLRQVVTATADGAIAAQVAFHHLKK